MFSNTLQVTTQPKDQLDMKHKQTQNLWILKSIFSQVAL